jgi:hypothetical protein
LDDPQNGEAEKLIKNYFQLLVFGIIQFLDLKKLIKNDEKRGERPVAEYWDSNLEVTV